MAGLEKGIMSGPRVIHCKSAEAMRPNVRYVGRGTIYGNDWSHKEGTKAKYVVSTVAEAIACYENWLNEPDQEWLIRKIKNDLVGMDLACWCKTKKNPNAPCHGDVLLRIANSPVGQ